MRGRSDFDIAFDDPTLVARIEAMSPSAIDALPFGVMRFDRRHQVALVNSIERTHAKSDADARSFAAAVAERFEGGAPIFVRIHEAAEGGIWMFLDRRHCGCVSQAEAAR